MRLKCARSSRRRQISALSRPPYPAPRMRLRRRPETLFDYRLDDFELLDYQHHPAIKAPVAV